MVAWMEVKNEKMLLSIPPRDVRAIDELVSSGRFATKSEVVRTALKEFLYEKPLDEGRRDIRKFEEFRKEVQAKIKEKGYIRKDLDRFLEEAKEETRKEVRRMLAEAKRKKA
jgi:Arc/MetJ-type ribon-helix-helix transcriptional regulator